MYAADNDDRCPPASEWMDAIYPYMRIRSVYVDPTLIKPKSDEYGYAFYRPASYVGYENVTNTNEVPIVFQSSDLRWNATGDLSRLGKRWRNGGSTVAFMDGHARAMPPTWPEKPIEIKFEFASEREGARK